jgi:hypothetical protein
VGGAEGEGQRGDRRAGEQGRARSAG